MRAFIGLIAMLCFAAASSAQTWARVPGCAKDVAVTREGVAWIVGCTKEAGGWSVHHWSGTCA